MSVCGDGWGEAGGCPCFDSYAENETDSYVCNLNVFERHKQRKGFLMDGTYEPTNLLPATCPHAQALKAVLEDSELELATLDPGRDRTASGARS